MLNRKLINIALQHDYFSGTAEFPVQFFVPGKSRIVADNYGLLFKNRGNQFWIYGLENFEPEEMERDATIWIYYNFMNEVSSNVTELDFTPDKDILYSEFDGHTVKNGAEIKAIEAVDTLVTLLDRCDTFGMDNCEPEKLTLPDGEIWDESLAMYLKFIEAVGVDEGFINLAGGAAEGSYLQLRLEGWTYPDGIIKIDSECLQSAAESDEPLNFKIIIPNREVFWCYHLIKDVPDSQPSYKVKATIGREIESEKLPEFEQIDSIAFAGERTALRFCSKTPVGLRNRYPFTIELEGQAGTDLTMKLPYPGVNVLSSIERSGKVELCSEIYLYL